MNQNPTSDNMIPSIADPSIPVVTVRSQDKLDDRAVRQIEEVLRDLDRIAAQLNSDDDYDVPCTDVDYPAAFRLSIVIPVFNEHETVRQVVARLVALNIPNEIIIVDDGSTDGTPDVLKKLSEVPNIHVVLKSKNEGKGAAVRTGFEHATGDIVVVQDADLEYDPRDIPQLLQPILQGRCDVVYGSRFLEDRRQGSSAIHRFGNRLLTSISNLTTGLRLTDMETCYKAFRREVLWQMPIRQDRFGFEPEVTAKLARRGFEILELPIRYNARAWDDGKKIGIKDAFEALFCIFRYAWFD